MFKKIISSNNEISQSGIVFPVIGEPCPPTDKLPDDPNTYLRQGQFDMVFCFLLLLIQY